MIGILLAAGRGTRMKSDEPKVLFDINDEPMCFAPFRALYSLCDQVAIVVGYRGAQVKDAVLERAAEVYGKTQVTAKTIFFTQEPPRGTGDAVRTALTGLAKVEDLSRHEFLVVNGDLPLIRQKTLERFLKAAREQNWDSGCLTTRLRSPTGLGRILRDETGVFTGIREEKDASADEKKIQEINGGVYFFKGSYIASEIKKLQASNKQGEFYLTDLLGNKGIRNVRTEAMLLRAPWDLTGVNTTFELALARKFAQARLQKTLCEEVGVEFRDPSNTWVSARAEFKGPSVIGPGTVIQGKSVIGARVFVQGNAFIDQSKIQDDAKILWGSVVDQSVVGSFSRVGPMAHLRPGTELGSHVKIGNFVELKKTKMGDKSKASHLAYLGDAEVGAESNIGCGTITCNYDGFQKHPTKIGSKAFIGSDTQLIAPVTIGDQAYVGSGTTVTTDVPAGALALSRTEMTIKPDYARKLSEKLGLKKSKT